MSAMRCSRLLRTMHRMTDNGAYLAFGGASRLLRYR